MNPTSLSRRESLRLLSTAAIAGGLPVSGEARSSPAKVAVADDDFAASVAKGPKTVAAVVTTYYPYSHADVLVNRLLRGWKNDDGPGPALKLGGIYIDQPNGSKFGLDLLKEHGVPVFDSIEGAITLGKRGVAVDGVLSIAEHGDYPRNEKTQKLYPRLRFLQGIVDTFRKHGKVAPVFNDKHLGPPGDEAKAMYALVKDVGLPFMAGSSLPLSYRDPEASISPGSRIDEAVGVGTGELDDYGIHTLEFYQCFVERREGGETGVRSARCLRGEAILKAIDGGEVPRDLLEAGLRAVKAPAEVDLKAAVGHPAASLFLFEYRDGFRGRVLMLPRIAKFCGLALRLKGESRIIATRAEERPVPHFPHFGFLLHAVERMIHTGTPTYPAERTLLTSVLLDRLLTSRVEGSRLIDTPELAISYRPTDYPHAPNPRLPL